jgi:asparagine synthase (glutamine-hydrolysing)
MRGMFAVAFWSISKRQLVVARDALGIKPLYLARNPDPQGTWSIAFSSELRSLLASGLLKQPKLNPAAVSSVVWNGFTVAPETSVSGVESLWPGEQRIYNDHGAELLRERHWQLPAAGSLSPLTEDELAAELEKTVKLHLASDVPLGVFLSGGVDSSAIANMAQRSSKERVHTFTMAFEEKERNEGEFSKLISKAIGTAHQEFLLTERYFMDHLDAALDSLDQPTFDGLNSYFMSHAVKDAGFKVALVGSGGDELFGGYTTFRDLPLLHRCARLTRWMPSSLVASAASAVLSLAGGSSGNFPPQTRWSKLPDMVRCKDDLLALYQLAYALFLPSYQAELLAAPCAVLSHGLPESTQLQLLEETRGRSALQAISILEQRLFLGERLLRDTDAVSMSASIEIRLPLVDQHLLTQVNRVPDAVRYEPIRRKALLRRIGLRGLAPELFDRPKSGFELPYDRWMRSRLGKTIGETFSDRNAVLAAGLNPAAVLRLWNAYLANTPGLYWSRVWSLYVLVRWCGRNGVSI